MAKVSFPFVMLKIRMTAAIFLLHIEGKTLQFETETGREVREIYEEWWAFFTMGISRENCRSLAFERHGTFWRYRTWVVFFWFDALIFLIPFIPFPSPFPSQTSSLPTHSFDEVLQLFVAHAWVMKSAEHDCWRKFRACRFTLISLLLRKLREISVINRMLVFLSFQLISQKLWRRL